jgi:PLP dependent protein
VTETIAGAVGRVREKVAAAAERAGRDPADVTIVGAVKYVDDPAPMLEAVDAGITDLGENVAQRLVTKSAAVAGARWHFLGPIQTNKVRLLDGVELVQSVDREREAEALDARGSAVDRSYDVLIEVNVAGEGSKEGVAPQEVEGLLERLAAYPRVRPRGFMFVAPVAQNPEDVRWVFAEGRRLCDRFGSHGLTELSMGMTDDYEVAIEEGATIVRIGRAIFAPDA